MIRKPYPYTDTVSFYNNNLPFEILSNNNILLFQISSDILSNSNIEQGFLFGKNVQTNGINELFYINKTVDRSVINVVNFDIVKFSPLKIYKNQKSETTKNTPLTVGEIITYMESSGFIEKQMVIRKVLYSSNVPNSNLLNLNYANSVGFKKDTDIIIDYLTINFNEDNLLNNFIITVDYANLFFISKNNSYSLNVINDNIKDVKTEISSLGDVSFLNYEKNSEDDYVNRFDDIEDVAPINTEASKLFIESPSLNSPVNKKTYVDKSNDYISNVDKIAYSIKINRGKEISDSDIITIDEASTIAKEIIQKSTSLSFSSIDEFEKFYDNICSNTEYLKKDLMINSEKGYVASYYYNTETVINHKSFKRLLSQEGKVDVDSYPVDKSSNYFNSLLTTDDRNNFIKLAQSIGVDIDFVQNKFGDIFNKLCSLILLLSYPSAEDLKTLLSINYAKPIYVNSFIIITPNIQYVIKNMSEYIFVSPVYIKIGTTFIIVREKIIRTIKSNLYYNFISPVYIDIEKELDIVSFNVIPSQKNIQINPFISPLYINKCSFEDLLTVDVNEDEKLWVKTRCQIENIFKYSILSSNRAINGIELSLIYRTVLSYMSNNYYICRNCLISKKFAALLTTFYIIKNIVKNYNIPVNIDLSKTITKMYSQYIKTEDNQYVTVNDICSTSSTSQSSFIDSFMSTNSVIMSTIDININVCQDSELMSSFQVTLDKFILSENDVSSAINSIGMDIDSYFSEISKDKLNSNFENISCQTSCNKTVPDKYILNSDNIAYGKFDLRYSRDAFSKTNIGSRNNESPCENSVINNNISYWTFLYIVGEYGDKPTNILEQSKGINSNTVGKLYYIDPDFTNVNTSVEIEELMFFDKKQYGYIATIKDSNSFIYYDPNDDVIRFAGNFDINIETGNDNDKYFIKINNLKIYTDTPKNPSVETIDTNVDSFDFSFIYEIIYSKDFTPDINALIGDGIFGMISYSHEEIPTFNINTIINENSIQDVGSTYNSSGAPLKDPGSIASPICEILTNPSGSFIPGHIKMRASVDAFMVTYDNGNKTIKNIGITIPFSFGVIDGYFNDDLGELLTNASDEETIDALLNSYPFNVKTYISPDKWYDFMSFEQFSDDDSIPENKITINVSNLIKKLKTLKNEDLYYTKINGDKINVADSNILYGDSLSVNEAGVYVSNINIQSDGVYAKAVTKNKFNPIAVLSANDGFKITNVMKFDDIKNYENISYVAYNDISNLTSTIYLYKKPLYNNGIFMSFNQNNKQG